MLLASPLGRLDHSADTEMVRAVVNWQTAAGELLHLRLANHHFKPLRIVDRLLLGSLRLISMSFICRTTLLLWHQPEDIVKSLLSTFILLRVQEIIAGALDAILVADGAGESRRAKLALTLR